MLSKYLQSSKTFWLLNWVSISQVYYLLKQADCCQQQLPPTHLTHCACACQSHPPKQCQSAAPRAWPLILQSKPLIAFRNSLWSDDQTTRGGLNSTRTRTAWPTSSNLLVQVYLLWSHSRNCVEFEFFLGQLKMCIQDAQLHGNYFNPHSPSCALASIHEYIV